MITNDLRGRLLVILAVVLFLCPVGGASAEPEVHQGTPKEVPKSDPRTFTSPMIMETKLEAARPDKQLKWVTSDEFTAYVCDKVHLTEIRTYVEPRKKTVDVTIYLTTYTERGLDKKVDVLVEIHVGDQLIGSTTIGPFAAEEHKEGYSGRVIKVPLTQWPADVVPDLRLTMNVVDDP
jgi:hypothetical protein